MHEYVNVCLPNAEEEEEKQQQQQQVYYIIRKCRIRERKKQMASLTPNTSDGNRPLLPSQVNEMNNYEQINATYENLVHHAAVSVHAGLHGRMHIGLSKDSLALRVAFFYHSSKWRAFYLIITACNLSLAFWENDAGQEIQYGSAQFYLLFFVDCPIHIYRRKERKVISLQDSLRETRNFLLNSK